MLRRILTTAGVVMFGTIAVTGAILYGNLKKQVVQNAKNYNRVSVQQINYLLDGVTSVTNIISTDRNLHAIFANYYQYPKRSEQYREQINLRLNEISYINSSVRSIVFVTSEQDVFATTSAYLSNDLTALKADWYKNLQKDSYYSFYSTPFTAKESMSQKPVLFSYYATYVHLTNGMEGNVLIKFDCSALMDSTQSVPKTIGECMWLTGDDKVIYPLGTAPKVETVDNSVVETKSGVYSTAVSDKSMWKMVCYTSVPVIWESIRGPMLMQCGSILLLTFVIILVMFALLIKIVRPVNMLSRTMARVAQGDFSVRSAIHTGDEIEDLGTIFNSMAAQIQRRIDQEIEFEKSKQQMKYSLLISQIDPHFIYNTMNTVNYLARKDRCQDVIEVNSALICILQDRLRVNGIEVFDSVRQEVDIVNQYFKIQQYRYSNRIRLEWNVAPSVLDMEIPKNIVQPLVENSYYHGFLSEDTEEEAEGVISVSIVADDGHLIITVADNGGGMDEQQLAALNGSDSPGEEERGRHIGIRNIRERLAFLYGTDDCMKFESRLGMGTRITVTLEKREPKKPTKPEDGA